MPAWLKALHVVFRDRVLLGGPSLPLYEVEPPSWLAGKRIECDGGWSRGALSLMDLGRAAKEADPLCVWGLNFSITRSEFETCGGFHPDIAPKELQRYQGDEEIGLCHKIKFRGLRAMYHPGAAVTHVIPATRLTPISFEQRGFYQGVCELLH